MKLLARFVKRISYRWVTLRSLFGHFSSAQRAFLLPLVILVLLAGLLLLLSTGVGYVAPFVYTAF